MIAGSIIFSAGCALTHITINKVWFEVLAQDHCNSLAQDHGNSIDQDHDYSVMPMIIVLTCQELWMVAATYGFVSAFGQNIALIPTLTTGMKWFPRNKVRPSWNCPPTSYICSCAGDCHGLCCWWLRWRSSCLQLYPGGHGLSAWSPLNILARRLKQDHPDIFVSDRLSQSRRRFWTQTTWAPRRVDLTRATSQTLTCSVGGTLVMNILIVMRMVMATVMVITILDNDCSESELEIVITSIQRAEFPACCSH